MLLFSTTVWLQLLQRKLRQDGSDPTSFFFVGQCLAYHESCQRRRLKL